MVAHRGWDGTKSNFDDTPPRDGNATDKLKPLVGGSGCHTINNSGWQATLVQVVDLGWDPNLGFGFPTKPLN